MSKAAKFAMETQDQASLRVALLTPVLAIFLTIFTIAAHRSHSESLVLQNEANNLWSYFQAKRIRDYQLELNADLLKVMAPSNPEVMKLRGVYAGKRQQYADELQHLQIEAQLATKKNLAIQKKALYYNLSEGLLEISLVLSSLYYVARRKIFPLLGILFGGMGILAGLIALVI